MSIDVSQQTEARLIEEAVRQGVSMDVLLEELLNGRSVATPHEEAPELPLWNLGATGSFRSRDIYNDDR